MSDEQIEQRLQDMVDDLSHIAGKERMEGEKAGKLEAAESIIATVLQQVRNEVLPLGDKQSTGSDRDE